MRVPPRVPPTTPVVQWLRLGASNTGVVSSIPGRELRSHEPCGAAKKKKRVPPNQRDFLLRWPFPWALKVTGGASPKQHLKNLTQVENLELFDRLRHECLSFISRRPGCDQNKESGLFHPRRIFCFSSCCVMVLSLNSS